MLQVKIARSDALGSGVCLKSGHKQLLSVQKISRCGIRIRWAWWYLVKGDDLEVFFSPNGSVIVFGCFFVSQQMQFRLVKLISLPEYAFFGWGWRTWNSWSESREEL